MDRFSKERLDEITREVGEFMTDPERREDKTGCGEGWHNMKEEVTKLARGIYSETGLYASFCRHSVCFLLCDMLRSGEL